MMRDKLQVFTRHIFDLELRRISMHGRQARFQCQSSKTSRTGGALEWGISSEAVHTVSPAYVNARLSLPGAAELSGTLGDGFTGSKQRGRRASIQMRPARHVSTVTAQVGPRALRVEACTCHAVAGLSSVVSHPPLRRQHLVRTPAA